MPTETETKNAALEPKRYVVIRVDNAGVLLYGVHAVVLGLTDAQPVAVFEDCGEAVGLARELSRRRCPFSAHYSDPGALSVAKFLELLTEMVPGVCPRAFEYQHVAALLGLARAFFTRLGYESDEKPNRWGDVKRRLAELVAEVEQLELDNGAYESDGKDNY